MKTKTASTISITLLAAFLLIGSYPALGATNEPIAMPYIMVSAPDTINAVVGDTLQLYNKGLFRCPNPYIYDVNITCAIGQQFPRYFELTPKEENIGEHNIEFTIKDSNNNILGTKTSKIIVRKVVKSPTTTLNVLYLGASEANGGVLLSEFKRRLIANDGIPIGNNLTNVNFVGRKLTLGVNHEATGGYSFGSFLSLTDPTYRFIFSAENLPSEINMGDTYSVGGNVYTIKEINIPTPDGKGNIGCSGTGMLPATGILTKVSGVGNSTLAYESSSRNGNPFVYDGAIDIKRYANDYCGGRIDVVYLAGFGNGNLPYADDQTSRFVIMQNLIDAIKAVFPNCKFGIALSYNPDEKGGMGINYNAAGRYSYGYGIKYSNFVICNQLQEYITTNSLGSYVSIVNWLNEFDQENNFISYHNKKVNVRASATEPFGANGLHPTSVGHYQLADVLYRHFIINYCQ